MVTEGTWHDLNSFQIYCFMAQVVAYLGKCFIHKIIMSREIMPSHTGPPPTSLSRAGRENPALASAFSDDTPF